MPASLSTTDRHASPRREAAVFAALALGFAVAYGGIGWLANAGVLPFTLRGSTPGTILGALLRTFGPALAAVLCAAGFGGRRALRDLGASLAAWRLPAWLWLLALVGPFVAITLVVATGVATGTLVRAPLESSPLRFLVVFLAMAVVDGPLGEEVGWRGYLLPRLLDTMGALRASLVAGVVWWLWHVPLYLADGRDLDLQDWGLYLLTNCALATVFTWFWLRSGGSTLLAVALHATTNFAVYLLLMNLWKRSGDSPVPQLAHAAVVVAAGSAAALALLRRDRRAHLAPPPLPARSG